MSRCPSSGQSRLQSNTLHVRIVCLISVHPTDMLPVDNIMLKFELILLIVSLCLQPTLVRTVIEVIQKKIMLLISFNFEGKSASSVCVRSYTVSCNCTLILTISFVCNLGGGGASDTTARPCFTIGGKPPLPSRIRCHQPYQTGYGAGTMSVMSCPSVVDAVGCTLYESTKGAQFRGLMTVNRLRGSKAVKYRRGAHFS